jgi:hypothetical protein
MKIKEPMRPFVNLSDFENANVELIKMVTQIRDETGSGAFLHVHEILGMVDDQHEKIRKAVIQAVYTKDGAEVKLRCLKFAYGLLFAVASLNVLEEKELEACKLYRDASFQSHQGHDVDQNLG